MWSERAYQLAFDWSRVNADCARGARGNYGTALVAVIASVRRLGESSRWKFQNCPSEAGGVQQATAPLPCRGHRCSFRWAMEFFVQTVLPSPGVRDRVGPEWGGNDCSVRRKYLLHRLAQDREISNVLFHAVADRHDQTTEGLCEAREEAHASECRFERTPVLRRNWKCFAVDARHSGQSSAS